MRDDFACFILTHKRANNMRTEKTLQKHGYTGKVYFIIDDEDDQADLYYKNFGRDRVIMFSKAEIEKQIDTADNTNNRGTILHARNACFDIAEQLGLNYFIQLDDDYTSFFHRFNAEGQYDNVSAKNLDSVFDVLISFYESTPFTAVAMSQGGDHIGGSSSNLHKTIIGRRKAMNSFICSPSRRFTFSGKANEDVNTYTMKQRAGCLFFTIQAFMLVQMPSQKQSGGITEFYLEHGTYFKAFASVMHCPSAVKISTLKDHAGDVAARVHHKVNYDNCAPQIIREKWKKKTNKRSSNNGPTRTSTNTNS